jgi:hypothetical protein
MLALQVSVCKSSTGLQAYQGLPRIFFGRGLNMRYQTCFDCLNAEIDPGYSATRLEPGEPASTECITNEGFELMQNWLFAREKARDAFEEFLRKDLHAAVLAYDFDALTYNDFARFCPHFNPQLVEKCGACGKEMNVPEYSWPYRAAGWEDYPVCDELCKKLGTLAFNYEMRECYGDLRK